MIRESRPSEVPFVEELKGPLQALEGFVALTLTGSRVHGPVDVHSDVDVNVYLEPSVLESSSQQLRDLLVEIPGYRFLIDISDLLPHSVIAVYRPHQKLHVTAVGCGPEDELPKGEVLIAQSRPIGRCSGRILDSEVLNSPERLYFWCARYLSGKSRGDLPQMMEAVLGASEVLLAHLAQQRQSVFHGLRKAREYLSPEESNWLDASLVRSTTESADRAIRGVVEKYFESGSDASFEVRRAIEELLDGDLE